MCVIVRVQPSTAAGAEARQHSNRAHTRAAPPASTACKQERAISRPPRGPERARRPAAHAGLTPRRPPMTLGPAEPRLPRNWLVCLLLGVAHAPRPRVLRPALSLVGCGPDLRSRTRLASSCAARHGPGRPGGGAGAGRRAADHRRSGGGRMRRWSRLRQRRVVHRAAAGRITAGAVACCHHGAAPARESGAWVSPRREAVVRLPTTAPSSALRTGARQARPARPRGPLRGPRWSSAPRAPRYAPAVPSQLSRPRMSRQRRAREQIGARPRARALAPAPPAPSLCCAIAGGCRAPTLSARPARASLPGSPRRRSDSRSMLPGLQVRPCGHGRRPLGKVRPRQAPPLPAAGWPQRPLAAPLPAPQACDVASRERLSPHPCAVAGAHRGESVLNRSL